MKFRLRPRKLKLKIMLYFSCVFLLIVSVFVLSQMVLAQNTSSFQIKDSYIEVKETDYPQNIALVQKENGKEKIAGQVKIVDQYLLSDIPENEFLDEYSGLKEGFQDLTISLETNEPLFNKENFYHPPSLFDKTKSFFGFETLPEYRITKEVDKSASVKTEIDLKQIKIETHYEKLGIENGESRIKQTLTFTNNSDQDLNLSLLLKNQIEADKIYWNNQEYAITENTRKFVNPDRISFNTENSKSFYDFFDVPDEFEPELWAERKNSQSFLILSLNIFIPAGETKTIDPTYGVEITILNVHSHPQAGDNWTVSFETKGTADLTITPDDQASIDDLDFVSLKCGEEEKPEDGPREILENDVIFHSDWQCDGTGEVVHRVNVARAHVLKFQFGDQVAYAYNNPDIVIEAAASANQNAIALRGGVFWTSPTVGYVIYLNTTNDLVYRKTADGGATWAAAVPIVAAGFCDAKSYDCWADWQTDGDAGTKIHIAYMSWDTEEIRYVYLDTNGDSVGGDDLIETCQGTGFFSGGSGFGQLMVSITKTRGGNFAVAFKYRDSSNTMFSGFYTSPDAATWTGKASPYTGEAYEDYCLLFLGNEADNQDVWGIFWDTSADEISLKTYDDSGNSWSEQAIASSMEEASSLLQWGGAIRHSDGHLIFVCWSAWDWWYSDLRCWDINGAGSITEKTALLTDTPHYQNASVFINQATDDIYVAYVGGTAAGSLVKAFYKKSVDGGANWGGQTALQADEEDDERWISCGAVNAAWGGKFQPVWFNDDLDDLFTNTDNGISIAAAAVENTAPTGTINSASEKTDGTGTVDISIEVDDADDDDTCMAKIEYKAGSDCSTGTSKATIDETDAKTTADYGDPKVENDNAYQVGNSSGWIITSSGSNTVELDWLSATDVSTADGTYCIKVTVNDGTDDQETPATTTLTLDNVAPTSPGNLTDGGKTTSSITLTFGSQTTETNFKEYKIFYKQGTSGVTESDTEHDDSDLDYIDYNSTSNTAVSDLNSNTDYVFNIWAYDNYGHKASATEVTIKTLNTAPSFTAAPYEDPASYGSSPTNEGTNVTFKAIASDPEGEQYYLAICKAEGISAGDNAAPTCTGEGAEWCISSATNDDAEASCTKDTTGLSSESYNWHAYVCDKHSGGGLCSSVNTGAGNSGSPFKVNHRPTFTTISDAPDPVSPGSDITFSSTASDSDTDTVADTVKLVVCKTAGVADGACDGGAEDTWCASSLSASNPSCNYSALITDTPGVKNHYPYVFDNHNFGAATE